MEQTILRASADYSCLDKWFTKNKRIMLVCGNSIDKLKINDYLMRIKQRFGVEIVRFSDFMPNPDYMSVVKGVELFRKHNCDSIIAIGGGSAIDVAKCIKLFSTMDGNGNNGEFLSRNITKNHIPFCVMPTTSGTGSEATHFAVIYYEGVKQSVAHISALPEVIVFDSSALKTLPLYQKKSTMLDALCHAIESYWCVNSTNESKEYSLKAISLIVNNLNGYLDNCDGANSNMLEAAFLAGKAINITKTTAGHAMCYKITSLFNCAHGHAAALCDRILFKWMAENTQKCSDKRGIEYLQKTLDELGIALGGADALSGAKRFCELFDSLNLSIPTATLEQIEELKSSVNTERLSNHPIALDSESLGELYKKILKVGTNES